MLQALRDKTSGWIAIVIVLLLCIPFAFFGMEQYLFQGSANYAAKVEAPPSWWRSAPNVWLVRKLVWQSEEVTPEAFRSQLEQVRQQQRSAQGEAFDARDFETIDSKRRVLDALIDRAAMRLATRSGGIAVSDAQVRDEIQAIPAFQVEGRFDPQRYQLALQSQVPARTPTQFEQLVRDGLQQALVPTAVAGSAFVTQTEVDRLLRLLGERRDVSFMALPPPAPDTAAVTGAEIQAWYAANAADFVAPESVTVEYVDIDGAALPAPPAADEAALRSRYAQEQARFVDADQRLVSHILVRVDADADTAAQSAAEARAAQLAGQARTTGADFAALARASSDDDGSKSGGGDLGWIERGLMAGAFEDAVFAMSSGEIRGPVKTDFGWHVIQLREIRSGARVGFEEARATLAAEQETSDRERGFNELIGRLVDQVYRNPGTLAPAAGEAGLEVRTLGPFARGEGTGIAANSAVQRAAFSDALVQDGTVSDPIELGSNRSVLIRVTAHTPRATRPLTQVRDAVIAAIRTDRASRALQRDAEAFVARVEKGEALSAVAISRGVVAQDVRAVTRGAPVPDPAAAEAYFQAPVPVGGAASPGMVALPDGSYVVFAVTAVTPGDGADASPQERAALHQQLQQLVGNEEADGLVRTLRQRMKITVVESRL